MPAKQFVQIPVKMGSNKFNFELILNEHEQRVVRCGKFIEMVLRKCNLTGSTDNFSKTYSIFENSFGVERLLNRNENIIQILQDNHKKQIKFEFVIRKCNLIEKKIQISTINKRNSTTIKKYYKKMNQLKIAQQLSTELRQNNESIIHIYEHIESLETSLKVTDDEPQHTTIQHEQKLNENINLLKQLYTKLKIHNALKSNKAYFQSTNSSKTPLLTKDYNSCGNSSDDNDCGATSSGKSSRSTSSSTLESLV